MILTGKCKKCFLNYVYGLGLQELLVYDVSYNSMVIEWLDSVGIYIHVDNLTNVVMPNGEHAWQSYIKRSFKNRKKCADWCETRQQATQQAIKQANILYNESKN